MLRSGLGCRLCSSTSGAGAPAAAELGLLLANDCSGGISNQCLALPGALFLPAVILVSEWPVQLQWCCQGLSCGDVIRHSCLCMSGIVV